jgi:hypothetical protein
MQNSDYEMKMLRFMARDARIRVDIDRIVKLVNVTLKGLGVVVR